MFKPLSVGLGALALSAVGGGAAAQEAETTADLRCLVIVASMAGASEGKQQDQMVMAALYYLGRLDGRTPSLDLESRLRTEFVTMMSGDMAAEGQRCGAQLMKRGQEFQAIGARLAGEQKTPQK